MFLWQICSYQRQHWFGRILGKTGTTHGFNDTEMNMASSSSNCVGTQILTLNIKYRHISSTVNVSPHQSVADLKTTALQKFELLQTSDDDDDDDNHNNNNNNGYRLIYCGRPLNEKDSILDLNLEHESNLHVIKIDPKDTLQLRNDVPSLSPSDYFIYCPLCKSIQASKIRTKCSQCSELNSFLINQQDGSRCRENVLSCPKVHGSCTSVDCKSTQAEFIFQCKQQHQFTDSVPLKHIRNNARHIICITCEEVHSPVIVFPCDQQHTMCLNCFKVYSIICLNERRFQQTEVYGYTLSCPARCPNSHIQEAHHFHILGPEEYERYKNFGTEEFIIKEGGVLCPNPKCGQGLLPEANSKTITCSTCQYEFCPRCSCDSHLGACGDQRAVEDSELSSMTSTDVFVKHQEERKSLIMIGQISKLCPNCNVKTEKSGGCNHMRCSRCLKEWCWICVKSWNQECSADHWLD